MIMMITIDVDLLSVMIVYLNVLDSGSTPLFMYNQYS
jgi:hypothetical protein